jgi:hypothetical protein
MGTWGFGSFDNDAAVDLLAELMEEEGGATVLVFSIQAAANTPSDEYLDSEDAAETLVAMEFLAAQKGFPPDDFPGDAKVWLGDNDILAAESFIGGTRKEKEKWLTALAIKALERIRGANSELNETWEDSEEYQDWLGVLDGLRERLLGR